MSMTFFVREACKPVFNADFVCPECGSTPSAAKYCHCDVCGGYGTDPMDDPIGEFSLNVTGSSARVILYDLLNYGSREKSPESGSLDPTDVLIRLTTAGFRVPSLVTPNTETGGEDHVVISESGVSVKKTARMLTMGYSEERLQGYVDSLTRLATKAVELGVEIDYED